MDKRTRLLTILLSLTLLVSLTLACSLPGAPSGGGAVPGGEETPAVQPPTGETPAAPPPTGETPAASPGQQFPFEMNEGALDNLNSYGYTFHFDGLSTMEGGVQKFELSTEGKRENSPSRAEQVAFHSSSDGDTQDVEFIYIEDLGKMWSKEGGGDWQELPVMDPSMLQIFDAFSLNFWWSAIFAGNPEGAQYVGDETINGVSAHHYTNTESGFLGSAVAGCTFASFQDDIWVAVDGSFPVKRQVGAQATCQGESGNFNLSMEVRDVNQPQNIQPPV